MLLAHRTTPVPFHLPISLSVRFRFGHFHVQKFPLQCFSPLTDLVSPQPTNQFNPVDFRVKNQSPPAARPRRLEQVALGTEYCIVTVTST